MISRNVPIMEQLAQCRRTAGITPRKLADRIGVAPGTVYKWEHLRGAASPRFGDMLAYARAVGRHVALWDGSHVLAYGEAIPSALPGLRVAAGLSQRDLARLMHIGYPAVVMRETHGCSRLSSIEEYLAPLGARLILLPGEPRGAVAS